MLNITRFNKKIHIVGFILKLFNILIQDEDAEKKDDEEKTETDQEKEKAEEKPKPEPIPAHYFRVGFSLLGTSLQLGEVKHSFAYESTGKFVTESQFEDYGVTFGVGDVVGAYLVS